MATSFNDSPIYTQLLKGPRIQAALNKINLQRDALDEETLNRNLSVIKRRVNAAGKGYILDHILKAKDFILVDSKDSRLPSYINFLPLKFQDRVIVMIDVHRILKSSGDMLPKQFFGYLQNALISYEATQNWTALTSNTELVRHLAISYSKLLMRVLDKLYGISLYPEWADVVSFLSAKFFLLNAAGRADDKFTDSIAYNAINNNTAISSLKEIENKLYGTESSPYDDFFGFIDKLSTLEHMSKFQARGIIESWVRMYGESTILALDYLPSLLQMVLSSVMNAEYNNEFQINNTIGKEGNKVYTGWSAYLR